MGKGGRVGEENRPPPPPLSDVTSSRTLVLCVSNTFSDISDKLVLLVRLFNSLGNLGDFRIWKHIHQLKRYVYPFNTHTRMHAGALSSFICENFPIYTSISMFSLYLFHCIGRH